MFNRRDFERIRFGRGYGMRILDHAGTWQVPCTMIDVSAQGAKLHLDAPVDGIALKLFILKLAQFGPAQRNCELIWQRGEFIGVRFLPASATVGQTVQ